MLASRSEIGDHVTRLSRSTQTAEYRTAVSVDVVLEQWDVTSDIAQRLTLAYCSVRANAFNPNTVSVCGKTVSFEAEHSKQNCRRSVARPSEGMLTCSGTCKTSCTNVLAVSLHLTAHCLLLFQT